MADDPSLQHVLGRLDVLRLRVAAVVAARRQVDSSPDDPFLGLYLSDEKIDELLHNDRVWVAPEVPRERWVEVERVADEAAAAGAVLRLRTTAARFDLDELDVDILLAAMAPDIDDRFERYYGYLNDDVTRRRASVGLALGLCGVAAASAAGRRRVEPGGRLVASGLLEVEEPERPFLTRPLRVPDRVTAHVLGADEPDAVLEPVLVEVAPTDEPVSAAMARAVADAAALVYVHDRESAAVHLAVDAAHAAGVPAVVIDLTRVSTPADIDHVVAAAVREARLGGGLLVAGPVDVLAETHVDAIRTAGRLAGAARAVRRPRLGPGLGEPRAVHRRAAAALVGEPRPAVVGRPRRARRARRRGDRRPVPPGSGADPPRRRGGDRRRPADRRPGDRGRRAPRRPPAERRRLGAAGPTHRAAGRLGRPRPACPPHGRACAPSPTEPGSGNGCSASGTCVRVVRAASGSRRCSPATPARARR